ncbi:MAG: PGPGW domain-containing protein [Kofleriaceae bacterium]
MFARVSHEWRLFKDDAPGERFRHHYARTQQESRAAKFLRLVIGIIVLILGIAMLVLPGPGIVGTIFGLALITAHSRWLAEKLDHAEVRARTWWRRRRER